MPDRDRTGPAIWSLVLRVGTAAVLLYRYVNVGALGPLPDMYENTWQVPGKLVSAVAEGAVIVLAGLGLRSHRRRSATEPPVPVAAIEEAG